MFTPVSGYINNNMLSESQRTCLLQYLELKQEQDSQDFQEHVYSRLSGSLRKCLLKIVRIFKNMFTQDCQDLQ